MPNNTSKKKQAQTNKSVQEAALKPQTKAAHNPPNYTLQKNKQLVNPILLYPA